jgi:hypothetical protein
VRVVTRFIEVSREQGVPEALRKISRRLRSLAELGRGLIVANLRRLLPLSDRGLMEQVASQWDGIDEFIGYLRTKDTPAFPSSDETKDDFILALREYFPDEVAQTIEDAERICCHEFEMLGQDFLFPGTINWHFDPASGESWPKQYIGMMERWFWTAKRSKDALPVWEFNRHQFLTTLGEAYWLTNDQRYASEFRDQIVGWIKENPCQFGINWFSVLEIAVRVISWSLAFYFFRDSTAFTDAAAKAFVKSLYQQTRFLRYHLTLNWQVQNNWLIGQAVGLVTVGALFPEFSESRDWVETGLQLLEREVRLQISPDGVNREQATGYHRFVLDLLLLIVILGRRGAFPRSMTIERVVEAMLDYALYAMDPQGRLPQLGDTDEGWGFSFNESADYWDVRAWLAVGAVLFHRPEFKFASQGFSEEAFWLLGEAGLSAYRTMEDRIPSHSSFSFDQGGHYILKDNWTPESDFLIIKSGEFGLGGDGFCAHAHCDLLSFVLWIRGKPVIVDSGTFTYLGAWRNRFRLTSAHNTVRIDGSDQAVPINDFFWSQVPRATCEHHNGQSVRAILPDIRGVRVEREIHHPVSGVWHIEDSLSGEGEHAIEWFFHFAPDLSLRLDDLSESLVVEERDSPYLIITPPPDVRLDISSGWYSSRYGHKEPNPLLVAAWRGTMPVGGTRFCWKFRYAVKERE